MVNPVLTVNPVTPIEIGLDERTRLEPYRTPQLIVPNIFACPSAFTLVNEPVVDIPAIDVTLLLWTWQVQIPFAPSVVMELTM